MIEVDQYQRIRYLHSVEGLSQREIAKRLDLSRNTVAKYAQGAVLPGAVPRQRKKSVMTDEAIKYIKDYLAEDEYARKNGANKQQHTAKRIYERLQEALGFSGSYESVVKIVNQLRVSTNEAFVPLSWDSGDALQVDWGQAKAIIAGKRVTGHIFCARLCHCALPFVVMYPAEKSEFFIDGHRQAFEFFKGVTRRVIYDNLRTAVKEGWGRYVKQKQPALKLLEAHYAFTGEFCSPRAGNEKGLVEGLVGWARRNILVPIPRAESWDAINALLRERCIKYTQHRIEGRTNTVGEEYADEIKHLLHLPEKELETCRTKRCRVKEDCLIRLDNNYYSVPSEFVKYWVTAKAFPFHIEIWLNGQKVTEHTRAFGASQVRYKLEHYLDLLEDKPRSVRQARPVRAEVHARIQAFRDYLAPGAEGDLQFVQILRLLVEYGAAPVLAAIESSCRCGAHHYEAVRFALMQSMQMEYEAAPSIDLDELGPAIISTDLCVYDGLLKVGEVQ
ncbi:MAG: IS21 family transposase [Kiritimatiellia bacterium]